MCLLTSIIITYQKIINFDVVHFRVLIYRIDQFPLTLTPAQCIVRASVFGRHQFFGTSEHYRKAHGSLLFGGSRGAHWKLWCLSISVLKRIENCNSLICIHTNVLQHVLWKYVKLQNLYFFKFFKCSPFCSDLLFLTNVPKNYTWTFSINSFQNCNAIWML